MNIRQLTILFAVCLLLAVSCRRHESGGVVRSVYYWATTFDIDRQKAAFVRTHRISRMYVRYFDVVADGSAHSVPNATVRFATPVPRGVDVVPVVFVMPECVRAGRDSLAARIVRRVMQISAANDVSGVREIQIDCDWTLSTRRAYSQFMQLMLKECHSRGLRLSSTIRLHQLSQTPPPADRGVLMMYNTGDVTDPRCRKPILDMRDAAPYMPRLAGYALPLSAAYPVFAWRVLFRGGRFVGIVHYDGEYPVLPDDSIAVQQPSMDDIMGAVKAVESRRPDANREIILYDISNKNIKRFKPLEYEKIYNR